MNRSLRVIAASLAALSFSLVAYAQAPTPQRDPMKPGIPGKIPAAKPGRKMPMRDPKTGKFVKGAPKPGKMAGTPGTKKTMPMRDSKGRFMKKGATPGAPPVAPAPAGKM